MLRSLSLRYEVWQAPYNSAPNTDKSATIFPMDIHQTLNRLGLDAKKSLGQNFMIEEAALRKMIEAAALDSDDAVLEIGPGLGALTDKLVENARRVVAIEIDQRFVPLLRERYTAAPQIEIVHADILDADVCAL